LFDDQTNIGFDATYDYIKLIVSENHASRPGTDIAPTVSSTSLGNTTGDTTIAIDLIPEVREQWRLNNNLETEVTYKPPFTDASGKTYSYSAELPKVIDWQGKKHYVYNYREVVFNSDTGKYDQTQIFGEDNAFALVDLKAISEVTLTLDHGATFDRIRTYLSNPENAIVRQIGNTGANGKVKIAGENQTELVLYDWSTTPFNTTGQLEISYNLGNSYTPMVDSVTESIPVVPLGQNVRDTNLTATSGNGIAEGLLTGTQQTNVLRAGLQDGAPAEITIEISTCRATGHDFLDIGTGSYNQTNYPNVVLGIPATEANQANEVQERNKGRVFYMSTDQDGFFRVGRFFTVDQGTGTVTFAASIALSDVDGIGFKRGVVVTEFSSDTSMADNAIDSVPTESAVRGYVNRRLGYDQAGNAVTNPIGPSVLTQNGAVPLTGDLSAGGNTITNIAPVDLDQSGARDAVPREYVDSRAEAFNKLGDLRDVELEGANEDQLFGFSNTKTAYINSNTISPGAQFVTGRVLTNQTGTAFYGVIKGVRDRYDPNLGDVTIVTFFPGSDEFSQVNAYSFSNGGIASIAGVAIYEGAATVNPDFTLGSAITPGGNGSIINGPYTETINIAEEPFQDGTPISDIGFTTRRLEDSDTFNSFRGEYNASTTYQTGNIVEYEKSLYQATAQVTGIAPDSADPNWNAYIDTVREVPTAYIDFQINDEVIVDLDVNPDAQIQQSKLLMQDADVFVTNTADIETIPAEEAIAGVLYEIVVTGTVNFVTAFGASSSTPGTQFTANADGVTAGVAGGNATIKRVLTATPIGGLPDDGQRNNQALLGLSKFDGANFKVTRGHVQIKDNGITLDKIEKLGGDTVIGNSNDTEDNCAEVSFNTVVDQGGGILHTDILSTDIDGTETADQTGTGVVVRDGSESYTTIPQTTGGIKNSFVKTDSTGRVTANTIAIGQNTSYDVLVTFDTNGIDIKTPQGGKMFSAQYDTSSTDPVIYSPASLNIGNLTDIDGDDADTDPDIFDKSVLHLAADAIDDTPWIASRWAYHSFIESPVEKTGASTGIAIGAGSGKASSGEVAIVVADTSNTTSPIPAKFSVTGMVPDSDDAYNIGTNNNKYKHVYSTALTLNGPIAGATSGSFSSSISCAGLGSSGNISTTGTATISAGGNLSSGGTLTVSSSASIAGGYGSTGVSISSTGAVSMNGALTLDGNIVAGGSNQDIGSSDSPFRDIYGATFSGVAAQAKFADLAEMYVADADYEPGTVLVFGGEHEVTLCTIKGDTRVAGVVSTDPAYLMNSHQVGDNVAEVALTGRVPCKVIGRVRKGDMLVTSAVPGYAIVNNTPTVGTVIGKAIENKDDEGRGVIEVVVGRV